MNEHTEAMEPTERLETRHDIEPPTMRAVGSEAEQVIVPDAVKQSARKTAKDRLASVRGRGIEWMRASDLIVRGTSRVAGAGIRFHQEVGVQTPRGLASGVRAVSRRARELPPVSAFGRRNAQATAATRSGVGTR